MPAKSKSQQRLFSMALAVRKGDLPRNKVWKAVLDIVDSDMTNKEIEDFTVLKESNKYRTMKPLSEYIAEAMVNESKPNRDAFIEKVKAAMDKAIADKSIDAWFFNSAEADKKEKAAAEKYIGGFLPGKWKFIEISGNGTNVGEGWFKNVENDVTISLSCDNEGETDNDYIDDYNIE